MLKQQLSFLIAILFNCSQTIPYAIVDTDVTDFYGDDELITDPFIDTRYFDQPLGDPDLGEREIDAQIHVFQNGQRKFRLWEE